MKTNTITLDHGSGGLASYSLVKEILCPFLENPFLETLDDSAVVPLEGHKVAFTTDSFVVDPIFFPGGDIGSLSVFGTVNDLAMQGASPQYLTLGLIIEEGFSLEELRQIIASISQAAQRAAVMVVAGDTKVVPKGKADKIFINTSGIGLIPDTIEVGSHNASPGDIVLINGPIGDHGMAILTQREGLNLSLPLRSDCAPLNHMVKAVLERYPSIHVLRDPTRGGVATAIGEIARASRVGVVLEEEKIPIGPSVKWACEILGLDPLYIANEGKCLVFVPPGLANGVMELMKQFPEGEETRPIGYVTEENPGRALLKTAVGGTRILSMLTGEQLPRIC